MPISTPLTSPANGRLAIFGAGGSGRELAWLARQIWGESILLTFLVDDPRYTGPDVNGIKVMLIQDYANQITESAYVAAIGDPYVRERVTIACSAEGMHSHTLIHPRAEMSSWVDIERGSVICAGSVLTTNIRIGRHVHINIGCTVSHDVEIGDFATLSPGVHVSGHVHIGRRVFIGTGANIINGSASEPLTIGDDAVVAAGACVTRNVAPGTMVAGVPAVRKR